MSGALSGAECARGQLTTLSSRRAGRSISAVCAANAPLSGRRASNPSPRTAVAGSSTPHVCFAIATSGLLYDLIHAQQKRPRYREAEPLRSLRVDDQLELRGLFNG